MAIQSMKAQLDLAAALKALLTELFLLIAAKPKETILALQKLGVDIKLIYKLVSEAAKNDPAARQAQYALSQTAQMAQQGTKLQYIKRLRGECPEGFELKMFKAGGIICKKCEKKVEEEKCGGKMKKHADGGEASLISEFKSKRKK